MVGKSLQHLCIQTLAEHLGSIPNLGKRLAPLHKGLLLEHCASHDMLTGSRLPHITYNLICPAITRLNLYRSEQVNNKFLQLIAQSGCRLTALTIHKCENVTDEGVSAITMNQDQLITLELKKLSNFHGHGLVHVKSPYLERLDLTRCMMLSSSGPETLIKNNPTIKVLILNGCFRLTESIFPSIAKCLSKLEKLDISDVHCTDDKSLLMVAENCLHLRSLDIYGCNKVGGDTLTKVFTKSAKLQDLDLSYCAGLNNSSESSCLGLVPETIVRLTLTGIQLESSKLLLDCVSRLASLTELSICGLPAVNDESLPQILKVIGHQLTHLNLSATTRSHDTITDLGLEAITDYCPKIEVLLLSSPCGTYTGITLVPIMENPERCGLIRRIELSSREICKELVESISENCFNLEFLHLSGLVSVVNDHVLYNLAKNCRCLQTLLAKGCVKITDDGMCAVARSCPLKVLSLSGNRNITDKSIFTIANSCPDLEEIYLNGCYSVSPAVVNYLKDTCIPRVFIYHKLPNAPSNMLMAKNLDTGEFCRVDLMDS